MERLTFRDAQEEDAGLILHFIKQLASYEKMSDEVTATEDGLRAWIFEKKKAEVFFICEDDREVGFALYFNNFSTFVGKAGLYLEDLYIEPAYRGKGYGKAVFKRLAEIACERDFGRIEWSCLKWNKPSIDFYLSLGAVPMDGWTVYRLAGDAIKELAE
ncbi:MAG: GNAT family N-acetyltransferase [Lachnospiraceae bacterium]|nr:GNAT family N-acetyltransferase [Lachnospiraceae bacterium]